jgi:DNA polymerase family A/3'-5' exonuclease
MNTLYVDFETYYDPVYSLTKMQTDAYITDARFQCIGVSVALNDNYPVWYSAGSLLEYAGYLRVAYAWENSAVCCHNTLFDGLILSHHFGVRPKLWMDTLAMSRMVYPHLKSHSLSAMAEHLGLRAKGTEVANAMGLRLEEMTPQFLERYAEYCIGDTIICRDICKALLPRVPALELKQIDMTVRMFTEPQFVGDVTLLKKLYATEMTRKKELLDSANLYKDVVNSNDKFAAHLQNLGAYPPTKISPATGKQTWAFARTDKAFTALLEDDNEAVAAAVAARLGTKTAIAETRVLTMASMAERGPLRVYLNFWGAKTTGRYSGGNRCNWQNLPARGVSAGIRRAVRAPEGQQLLVGDSSNIELRVVMAGAGQTDVLQKLYDGVDLYCDFASRLFGRTITKADKAERMLGKLAMLGLGYGAGAARFREMVRIETAKSGNTKDISEDEALRIVTLYRAVHHKVADMWGYCGDVVLPDIANGCSLLSVDTLGWAITSNDGFGQAGQPGVKYHNLRKELMKRNGRDEVSWVYDMGRETVPIYSSKVTENWGQYIAGRIVLWQTTRFNQRYPVALSVHDEVVSCIRDQELGEARAYLEECLSMEPPWCRGQIPLACETGVGATYADAK